MKLVHIILENFCRSPNYTLVEFGYTWVRLYLNNVRRNFLTLFIILIGILATEIYLGTYISVASTKQQKACTE